MEIDRNYYDAIVPVVDVDSPQAQLVKGRYGYHPPYTGPQWGRDHPRWLMVLEVLIRLGVVILVFAANYAHLSWTLKKPSRPTRSQILKLLLVIILPTFVLSECLFSIGDTIALLFQMDNTHLRWPESAGEWERYLCSIVGMHVVPDPEIETQAEIESEAEEGVPTTATSMHKPTTRTATLADVKFYSDLRHHPKPWNVTTVLRMILLLLASLVPVIFACIPFDEFTELRDYFDVRYIVTIIGNGICTLAALIAIACRSEWSLNHLTTSGPIQNKPFFSFVYRLMVAAFFFEMFYFVLENIRGWDGFPGSFFYFFALLGWLNFFWPVFAFTAWVWRAEIAERVKINWWLVHATVLALVCVWIGFDLLLISISDIISIVNYSA